MNKRRVVKRSAPKGRKPASSGSRSRRSASARIPRASARSRNAGIKRPRSASNKSKASKVRKIVRALARMARPSRRSPIAMRGSLRRR